MQLAFARVKESWDEAYLTNLANRPLDQVIEKIRVPQSRAVHQRGLSAGRRGPRAFWTAGSIISRPTSAKTWLARRTGNAGRVGRNRRSRFSPLNVMILVRRPNMPDRPSEAIGPALFGNADEAFLQSKPKQGLLTPAEVRSMALAEMDLGPTSVVWDIGAGSGSVAIEAADRLGRNRVRRRNGPRGSSTDHGQCRAVWRREPGRRAGPRPMPGQLPIPMRFSSAAAAAKSAVSSSWPISDCARRATGCQCRQHCQPFGGTRHAATVGQGRERVDDQHRPRHVSAQAHALRRAEPDVSLGRGQAG